jgi:hypothetical protein
MICVMSVDCQYFFFCAATAQRGRRSPPVEVSRSYTIRHTHTHQWDSSVPVISSLRRPLPHNTQQTQETNNYVLGQIRTRGPNNQAAAQLRLGRRGHRDRCLTNQSHFFCRMRLYCIKLQTGSVCLCRI